jgi:hypothetical protein
LHAIIWLSAVNFSWWLSALHVTTTYHGVACVPISVTSYRYVAGPPQKSRIVVCEPLRDGKEILIWGMRRLVAGKSVAQRA